MQKGGLKGEIDFSIFIQNGIFKQSSDKLYFKLKKSSIDKIFLTLHSNGVIEYDGIFFKQTQSNYKLRIVESKISIPNTINTDENDSILHDMNSLKIKLLNGKKSTKTIYQYLYYNLDESLDESLDDKEEKTKKKSKWSNWLPYIGKNHKSEKENVPNGIPWISSSKDLMKDGRNYVVSIKNTRLRFHIDEHCVETKENITNL